MSEEVITLTATVEGAFLCDEEFSIFGVSGEDASVSKECC
jgi:hypothetical protein